MAASLPVALAPPFKGRQPNRVNFRRWSFSSSMNVRGAHKTDAVQGK